jgi:hypothetical protein
VDHPSAGRDEHRQVLSFKGEKLTCESEAAAATQLEPTRKAAQRKSARALKGFYAIPAVRSTTRFLSHMTMLGLYACVLVNARNVLQVGPLFGRRWLSMALLTIGTAYCWQCLLLALLTVGTAYYGTAYYGTNQVAGSGRRLQLPREVSMALLTIGTTYYGTTLYGTAYYGTAYYGTTHYGTTASLTTPRTVRQVRQLGVPDFDFSEGLFTAWTLCNSLDQIHQVMAKVTIVTIVTIVTKESSAIVK